MTNYLNYNSVKGNKNSTLPEGYDKMTKMLIKVAQGKTNLAATK